MELDYFGWVASLGKLLDPLGFDWKSLMSDSTFAASFNKSSKISVEGRRANRNRYFWLFDFFPVYTKHITLQSFSFCFRHLFSPLFQAGGLPRRAVTTFGPSWFSATGSFTVLRSNPISCQRWGSLAKLCRWRGEVHTPPHRVVRCFFSRIFWNAFTAKILLHRLGSYLRTRN